MSAENFRSTIRRSYADRMNSKTSPRPPPTRSAALVRPAHAATLDSARERSDATRAARSAFAPTREPAPRDPRESRPTYALQRAAQAPYPLRDPAPRARRNEARAHGDARVLTAHNYATLDRSQRYLWLIRSDGNNGVELAVGRRAGDVIGHPTLAYIGPPGRGHYRDVLIGGEMRYSRGIIGAGGWILDNESGRFGRLANATETQRSLQFALDLFYRQSGAVAYGDLLSASAWRRNLQLSRREWGLNWLSMGYMVSSNLSWPETLRRWVSVGLPLVIEAYVGARGIQALL